MNPLAGRTCRDRDGVEGLIVDGFVGAKLAYMLVIEVTKVPGYLPRDRVGTISIVRATDVRVDPAPADREIAWHVFPWKEAARRLAREMGARDLAADANPGQVIDAALKAHDAATPVKTSAWVCTGCGQEVTGGIGCQLPADHVCKPEVDRARGPVPPDHVIVALCRVCKGRTMFCTPDSESRLAWVRSCTAAGDQIDYVDSSKLGDYPACQCKEAT